MKKITKIFGLLLISCFMIVPGITAKAAAQPAKPTGLGLYGQKYSPETKTYNTYVDFNYNLLNPSYGCEVIITNLKGKKIKTYSTATDISSFVTFKNSDSKMGVDLQGKKFTTQPFIMKVRFYIYDENNQPLYSETTQKVIVPRAIVTKLKAVSRTKGKITWNKVSGAKKYTVYVSSNGGKKYKKVGSTKSNSFVVKNMKLGKQYPVYVVASGIKSGKKKLSSTKPEIKESGVNTIKIRLINR